jgi:hypothetical protein
MTIDIRRYGQSRHTTKTQNRTGEQKPDKRFDQLAKACICPWILALRFQMPSIAKVFIDKLELKVPIDRL